jgi:hypothetical protein
MANSVLMGTLSSRLSFLNIISNLQEPGILEESVYPGLQLHIHKISLGYFIIPENQNAIKYLMCQKDSGVFIKVPQIIDGRIPHHIQ